MAVYALGSREPSIHPEAFVHPDAVIIGAVTIGAESTVWPTAVLRGDYGAIHIGRQTSIQDGSVIHCTGTLDTVVGDRCVIGHNVHLEGCVIEDDCLIGSGSIVLHRAHVGPNSLVGAGALVGNDKTVPPLARALGLPARIIEGAVAAGEFADAVSLYVAAGHRYRGELRRLS